MGAVAALAWLAAPARAHADLASTCDQFASLITCAAADVGKPCQGGGSCYAVSCTTGTPIATNSLYKCGACPTVVPGADGGCTPSNVGSACGDGGACTDLPDFCITGSTGRFACATPPAAEPTGPPAGEGGGGGCDVSSPAPGAGLAAVALLGTGLAFLVMARRRRQR
jgi:hypothetical protein